MQDNQHSQLTPSDFSPDQPSSDFSPAQPSPDISPQSTVPGLSDPQPTDQLDFARRTHRSGRSFCTSAPRKPILKLPAVLSSPQDSQPFTCLPLNLKCDNQCCKKLSKKQIGFAEKLSIRYIYPGNNFEDFSQKMLIHPILGQNSTTYLMLSAIGIESGAKELFYRATWSNPNQINAKISIEIE